MKPYLLPSLAGAAAGLVVVLAGAQWIYPWLSDPTRGVPGFDPVRPPATGFLGSEACLHCHEGRPAAHAAGGLRSSELAPSVPPLPGDETAWRLDSGPPRALCGPDGECFEVALAIGSGRHRRAFLLRGPDGLWVRWDRELGPDGWLGPGDHFMSGGAQLAPGRALEQSEVDGCLRCHSTARAGAEPPGGVARLESLVPGVTCEACHGPGWSHVVSVRAGRPKDRVPRAGSGNALDRIRACGRCHGGPEQVPPAAVLTAPTSLADRPGVGALMSACYVAAAGPECTACHDPHRPDAPPGDLARQACLSCHAIGGERTRVTCLRQPEGPCLECHVVPVPTTAGANRPRYTDHWIRVRESDPGPATLITDSRVERRVQLLGIFLEHALKEGAYTPEELVLLYQRRATAAATLGDKPAAIAAMEKAVELAPEDADVHYNFGNIYMSMGPERVTQSLEELGKALALDPGHVMARIRMAEAFRRMGDFVSAEDQLQGAAREHPDDARVHRELGVVLLVLGRTEASVVALSRAVSLRDDFAKARHDLATALNKAGRYADALEQLRWLQARGIDERAVSQAIEVLERKLAEAAP